VGGGGGGGGGGAPSGLGALVEYSSNPIVIHLGPFERGHCSFLFLSTVRVIVSPGRRFHGGEVTSPFGLSRRAGSRRSKRGAAAEDTGTCSVVHSDEVAVANVAANDRRTRCTGPVARATPSALETAATESCRSKFGYRTVDRRCKSI